jgi:hypothetical protein
MQKNLEITKTVVSLNYRITKYILNLPQGRKKLR